MSERKTTEIKLRVTPAEKASWQLAAEQRGVGLSKLIRDCVQESLSAEQNQRIDGTALVDNAIEILRERGLSTSGVAAQFEYISTNMGSTPEVRDLFTSPIAPTEDVPTSDDESRVAKPWMFEARSGE